MGSIKEAFTIFWNFILTIGFWDVVDIALVAYIIYKLITFVRRTSAGSVVKGIIFLIAVLWLSSFLHLSVMNFLLGKTMQLGFLAIIVIFQPELRRFLEKMGSSNFRSIFGRRVSKQVIETVITQTMIASKDLSKSRTGALIVFERQIRLDDYIKTGTIIDSELTAELLKNIFFPKAPLHDGAIIIRNGRIVSAGCMLPLSSYANLSRDLGMRHRAGLGMSERSDAVVVIISEETGMVSVAVDGMLKRHLLTETFEKLLRNELLADGETGDEKLKKNLFNLFKVTKHGEGKN